MSRVSMFIVYWPYMSLYHSVNFRFDFDILIYFLIGKEILFVLLNQSA